MYPRLHNMYAERVRHHQLRRQVHRLACYCEKPHLATLAVPHQSVASPRSYPSIVSAVSAVSSRPRPVSVCLARGCLAILGLFDWCSGVRRLGGLLCRLLAVFRLTCLIVPSCQSVAPLWLSRPPSTRCRVPRCVASHSYPFEYAAKIQPFFTSAK